MNGLKALAMIGAGYMGKLRADKDFDEAEQAKADRAFQEETRGRQRKAWGMQDQLQTDLRDAATPQAVEQPNDVLMDDNGNPMPAVPAFRVGANRYGTQEQAQAAAAAANTPESMMQRTVQAYHKAGQPIDALRLQNESTSGKLHAVQLENAQQDQVTAKFLREAGSAVLQGGHDGAAAFLTKSKADGNDYTVARDDKGNVVYNQVNRTTGEARPLFTTTDDDAGRMDAYTKLVSVVRPDHALAHYKDVREQKHKDKEFKLKEDKNAADIAGTNATAEYHKAYADYLKNNKGKAAAGTGAQAAPIWDSKADDFLKSRYTVKNEATGALEVDGLGMEFAKTIALAEARRNGGDTTIALGKAFDLDARLKAAAGNDPAKVRAVRSEYLQRLMAPPAQPAAQPVTTAGKAAAVAPMGSIVLAPDGKSYAPMQAAAAPAAAPAAPAATVAPARAGEFTGIEGLSEGTLRRMAADTGNPRSALAATRLQQIEAERRAMQQQRVGDDQFNPAYYGGR